MSETLTVRGIIAINAGRVAVVVDPPASGDLALDLEFIHRAALSVRWNAEKSRLEDRYTREVSQVASFRRIALALESEFEMRLRAGADVKWEGITEAAREDIELDLGK